ncbi:MAG: DUF2892 domain-containing protein [Anaerolineae bacterium]|nr:DUF2892 domain-containing protein [Anaerolineae bacterium]
MKRNLGNLDRIIRTILGIAIMLAGLYFQTWLGVLGVVLLVTAAIGWCPLYAPFHISTNRA